MATTAMGPAVDGCVALTVLVATAAAVAATATALVAESSAAAARKKLLLILASSSRDIGLLIVRLVWSMVLLLYLSL